jgi:hypothetical protein
MFGDGSLIGFAKGRRILSIIGAVGPVGRSAMLKLSKSLAARTVGASSLARILGHRRVSLMWPLEAG